MNSIILQYFTLIKAAIYVGGARRCIWQEKVSHYILALITGWRNYILGEISLLHYIRASFAGNLLAQTLGLLANVSGQVEFYIPADD